MEALRRNVYYPHDEFKAKECVADLKAKGVDTVFMLGSADEAAAFLRKRVCWDGARLFISSEPSWEEVRRS